MAPAPQEQHGELMSSSEPVSPDAAPTIPIDMLPIEILYTIFLICYIEDVKSFPTSASHVCRQWRSIVLNSPVLWSTIEFCHKRPSWEKYGVWLARSQEAPLKIILQGNPFRTSSIKTLCRVLRLILPHTSRWQSVVINEAPEKILRLAIDRMRVMPMPMLQTINFTGIMGTSNGAVWKTTNFTHGIPLLHDVSLRWVPFNLSTTILSNLISVNISSKRPPVARARESDIDLILSILIRSPNLRSLRVIFSPSPTTAASPRTSTTPVLHRGLQYLNIPPTLVQVFLQEVEAPAAKIHCGRKEAILPISILPTCARWSTPHTLTHAPFYGAQGIFPVAPTEDGTSLRYLRAALNMMPVLEVLEFTAVNFGESEGCLTILGNHCPRLRSLVLRRCYGETMVEILQVVATRVEAEGIEALEMLEVSAILPEHPFPVEDAAQKDMALLGYKCTRESEFYRWGHKPGSGGVEKLYENIFLYSILT